MLDVIKNILWNYMFVPLFLIAGVICLRQIVKNKGAEKENTENKKGEVSPLQTLFVTLASTIGTGNIIGVSLAISVGGAGAVFWMWIAAFLGMAVSYTENVLGLKYRSKNNQPIRYMPKNLSKVFAFFCIFASLGIGNMIQSNSAANAMNTGFGIKKWVIGLIFMVLAYIIIKGGLKGITRFTDFFVPIMGLFYIVAAIVVIAINYREIPIVFKNIFQEALSLKAFTSGAVITGIARGVLSGEAGVGSMAILSSKSNAKTPHDQGVIGSIAIFIDTFVICTLTALVILSANASSTQNAFYSALGNVGGGILDISIAFFAFTTVVGWSYFGIVCTEYLLGEKQKNVFMVIYAIATFFGAVIHLDVVWGIGDISCALMAIPNLLCIAFLANKIGQSE
ncbi:MAG: alanine/glycine:cation symporter family protein [Clostridia bacterium]